MEHISTINANRFQDAWRSQERWLANQVVLQMCFKSRRPIVEKCRMRAPERGVPRSWRKSHPQPRQRRSQNDRQHCIDVAAGWWRKTHAAIDKDKPLHAVRVASGEQRGNVGTHRMPDHHHASAAKSVQHSQQISDMGGNPVRIWQWSTEPSTAEIRRDKPNRASEFIGQELPAQCIRRDAMHRQHNRTRAGPLSNGERTASDGNGSPSGFVHR
jgi:hypothetical protein